MATEITIALIGLMTTALGSLFTYKTTKKKYNTEVESSEIKNLKDSFEVYKIISDDNKSTILELINDRNLRDDRISLLCDENKKLNDKVDELIKVINELNAKICLNFECNKRVLEPKVKKSKTQK